MRNSAVSTYGNKLLLVTFLILMWGTIAGVMVQAETPLSWSKEDQAAAQYAIKKAANNQTITIDMDDSRLAHFLKRQFELAHMTADRYPGLHMLIRKRRASMPKTTTVSRDLIYIDTTTRLMSLYPTAAQSYTANGVASVESSEADRLRNLQIVYASLCFYDKDSQPIGTCINSSTFANPQYFPVSNSITTSEQKLTAALSTTFYNVDKATYIPQLTTLTIDSSNYPAAQTITNPVIVHSQNNALEAALVCTSRSVNSNANPGICDYGTYQTTRVLVDMTGTVTFTTAQNPQVDGDGHLVGTGSVSLINLNKGGECLLSPLISGNQFFAQPQVTYNSTTKNLAWDFDNLDFGDTTSLLCGGDGTDIQFSLVLQVNTTDDTTVVASQSSSEGVIVPNYAGLNKGALLTPMLRLVAGCLHPDSQITAADGTTHAISEFKGEGEKLRSLDGAEVSVVGTVNGKEPFLFVVHASNGMELKATAQHPFVLADKHWRAASDLKPGDKVLTEKGIASIDRINKIAYGGPIKNLVLAHPRHQFDIKTESFYANGFLVGGFDAQQSVASAKDNSPGRIHSLLPPEFRTDYVSHQQDMKAASDRAH